MCGGLDSPDSGEIIIKGRSSKDFTQSDFDSYRNTFVGFVFQEYNILNEFSVEDNIALALELQGKNKDKERINEILKLVELEDFAKRKPNTLSGGQKQRVAIARALVKNPEIIMADEPTGALDSATGKQVFDTLKKLSEEKLVIVVSHDREFAEIYGDRIIELKDGKIISDVVKTKVAARPASQNLSFIGDDIITIKSGSSLTAADVEKINKFLRSSPKDLIISCGERENADFKKAARIDEEGAREKFRDITPADISEKEYTPQDSNFIRSRLPMRHAVKIGASSLKVKPFRLFFTILLSFIAFALFGLFSTLTFYDPVETSLASYADSDYRALPVYNSYRYTNVSYQNGEEYSRYESSNRTEFTPADVESMRSEYGDKTLGIYTYTQTGYSGMYFTIYNTGNLNSSYYDATVTGFATFEPSAWQGDMLTDTDLSAIGEDDIVISSYTFDAIKEAGLYDGDSERIAIENYADIVGKTLTLTSRNSGRSAELNVAGVFRYNLPEKYDSLKEAETDRDLADELSTELATGIYRTVLVNDDFYDVHKGDFGYYNTDYTDYGFRYLQQIIYVKSSPENDYYSFEFNAINSLPAAQGETPENLAFFDGRTDKTLSDGEIVVQYNDVQTNFNDMFYTEYQRMWDEANNEPDYDKQQEMFAAADEFYNDMNRKVNMLGMGDYYDDETGEIVYSTDEEIADALADVLELADKYSGTEYADFDYTLYLESSSAEYGTFKVVGFTYNDRQNEMDGVYFSADDYQALIDATGSEEEENSWWSEQITNYVKPEDAIYTSIILPFPESNGLLKTLLSHEGTADADDTFFTIDTPLSNQLNMVNSMIGTLEQVFLWVGVVMAVFAMLLLFNFISVSITYKKKEIGILRAVGARSADVFKIFYSESIIITAICFVLAMIASFIVCNVLNTEVAGALGASIFVFGPLSWLVMLAIAVVTSFIGTFLPVYSIAKRKPVESIRAL